ncbi:YMD3-like protein [Mya arenaria]|uniref:YMD3-like protein n=1 Tax=Mya arenaria TaxID=6604 RepID=A0ABY7EWI4_MYAAR|nr:YMD3-like protein [Mya arenaria]
MPYGSEGRAIKERKPKKMWADKGKEFYNKDVQNLVEIYSTENEEKSSVVERWNRTMKEKMWKYFSANSTNKYIDILNDLVDQYNGTKHSSIKMTPVETSMKKNENRVYKNLYAERKAPGTLCQPLASSKPKYPVGDRVRITKKKKTFEKGYTPRWTEEVFSVSEIQYTNPVTYKIKDYNKEEIQGTFYEQELQKTDQEIFRIERVIQKKGKKALVKRLGYPESFNSWVERSDLSDIKTKI